jgi:hypothetical protein
MISNHIKEEKMLCPYCQHEVPKPGSEIIDRGWTCPKCGKSIPPFDQIKSSTNALLKSKAKHLYIQTFWSDLENIKFEIYNNKGKYQTYLEKLSKAGWDQIEWLINNKILSVKDWPKCRICKERPVAPGKDYCWDRSCISYVASVERNPMKVDPQGTLKKIQKTLKERYGVTNANDLERVRQIKSKALRDYWSDVRNRYQRADHQFESKGVFNIKQDPETIRFLVNHFNIKKSNNQSIYGNFLKALYNFMRNLDDFELLDPSTFEEFQFRLGEGKKYLYL